MVLEINFYLLAYWLFSIFFMAIYICLKYIETLKQINTNQYLSIFVSTFKSMPQYKLLLNKIKSPSVYITALFMLFVLSPIVFPLSIINIVKTKILDVAKLKVKVKELEAKIVEMEKALEDAKATSEKFMKEEKAETESADLVCNIKCE